MRILVFSALAAGTPAGALAFSDEPLALTRWARVLDRFVDDAGRVDFVGVAAEREDLDAYVAFVGATSPRSHPSAFADPAARLAYYINSYNALSMHGVLEANIPKSLGGLKKYWFFGVASHRVGGESLTLYNYENNHIRKVGDPRVHFALNCMSVGCPRLPREPFDAKRLEQQLDRETRRFFAEPRNLQVDHARKVMRVSELLDFYTEDFLVVAESLTAYVNRYVDTPIPTDYAIEFIDYDWTVNRQPSR